MVVSIESLRCFDKLIWLQTGDQVSGRLELTQASVSRAAHRVANTFGVALEKQRGEWTVIGDQSLLNAERLVHQQFRWQRDLRLRIEAQYYNGPLFLDPLPAGWVAGCFNFVQTKKPLELLRNGVIDAWLGCFPDLPEPDDDTLTSIHLTRLPTHLAVAADHPLVRLGDAVSLEDVRAYPCLALPDGAFPRIQAVLEQLGLWNSLEAMQRYDHNRWEGRTADQLTVAYASAFSVGLFNTPHVLLPITIPLQVGDSLVIKRCYADHPRALLMIAALRQRARQLAAQFPDVSLVQ